MIVCHCHTVSDREIAACVQAGATDLDAVTEACGAGSGCAGCHPRILELLAQAIDDDRAPATAR